MNKIKCPLEKTILLDDSKSAAFNNYENYIEIKHFKGEDNDDELLKKAYILKTIAEYNFQDIR